MFTLIFPRRQGSLLTSGVAPTHTVVTRTGVAGGSLYFSIHSHVPNFVLRQPDLSAATKLVYGWMYKHADDRYRIRASNRYIARALCLGNQTVERAIEQLKANQYIRPPVESVYYTLLRLCHVQQSDNGQVETPLLENQKGFPMSDADKLRIGAMVPDAAVHDRRLNPNAKMLLGVLIADMHLSNTGLLIFGRQEMATRLSITCRTLDSLLRDLVNGKWIERASLRGSRHVQIKLCYAGPLFRTQIES